MTPSGPDKKEASAPRPVRLPNELKKLDRSVTYLLHRADQLATGYFREEMGALGLTRARFTALLALARKPGLNQKQLAIATGIDTSTLTELIRRMEEQKLIARKRQDGSRRGYALSLTASGKRKLKNARASAAMADRRIMTAIDKTDRRVLLDCLMTLNDILKTGEKQARAAITASHHKARARRAALKRS
jgi:DNA-binding MarR family transcriptional regulator